MTFWLLRPKVNTSFWAKINTLLDTFFFLNIQNLSSVVPFVLGIQIPTMFKILPDFEDLSSSRKGQGIHTDLRGTRDKIQ